ncbi:uncharacterized protein LOC143029135 isoform X2 [Oratosquilla oratoria]|uniref:uncharacterized protein LOC143029135 isoform X2 n=1 Tax=Oratosquilla oratoria TaxID=337810 RepID=UPI003F776E24
MENSPINKAHRQHRRAEACLRRGQLEEAISYHRNAAELLETALTLTGVSYALESLSLQRDYHVRQQELLGCRIHQLEKYAKVIENHRKKMASASGGSSGISSWSTGSMAREGTPGRASTRKADSITSDLNKTTEKFDSLLLRLAPDEEAISDGLGGGTQKDDKRESTEREKRDGKDDAPRKESLVTTGCKQAKDLSVIVEELRTVKEHQSELIMQLVTELTRVEKENAQLKCQVKELQSKCDSFEAERKRFKAMSDSTYSPYVYSPFSESSPDTPGVPELAPLEMPSLDFMKQLE